MKNWNLQHVFSLAQLHGRNITMFVWQADDQTGDLKKPPLRSNDSIDYAATSETIEHADKLRP
ncbi:MAG: hypothetical protein ACK5YR_09535 [Pirellula sp.]